ncbi:MAG: hypothetical protein AB7E47_02785 [Desulfovibrionaceae bacterium]
MDDKNNPVKLPLPRKAEVILESGRRRIPATSRPIDTIYVTAEHRSRIVAGCANAKAALDGVASTSTVKPVAEHLVGVVEQITLLLLGSDALGGTDAP